MVLLSAAGGTLSPWLTAAAVAVRIELQTGLFIVGHDAMHGVLLPGCPALNDRIGALVLALYAAIPYGPCRRKHSDHHRWAGERGDPDFHAPGASAFLRWYARFMAGYLGPRQLILLPLSWALLVPFSSWSQVVLYCIVPLILSSLQLFVVGTYLPHRGPERWGEAHRIRSLDLPEWLSLLACFHFGYHLEHHQAPQLAWYELPGQRRAAITRAPAPS